MPDRPNPVEGFLAAYLNECSRQGWNPAANIQMVDGGDLPDEDAATLEGFSAEDFAGLEDLDEDELASLTPAGQQQRPDEVTRLRREAAKRRTELKPWKQLARDLDMTPDEIRELVEAQHQTGDGDDGKPKPRRKETRDAEDRANRKLVRAEVKLAAADLFADPADAALYVDLDKYDVDADGDLIDPDELLEDLQDVLERKPHLAKAKERKGPKPLNGQGRRDATTSGLDAGAEIARRRFGTAK